MSLRPRRGPLLASCVLLICCASPDHSLTSGVRDDDGLRAAVSRAIPVRTDIGTARRRMIANGFDCVLRTGTSVDTVATDVLGPPPARLTCIKDESARPETSDGFRRHFVNLLLQDSLVAGIEARSRIERLP